MLIPFVTPMTYLAGIHSHAATQGGRQASKQASKVWRHLAKENSGPSPTRRYGDHLTPRRPHHGITDNLEPPNKPHSWCHRAIFCSDAQQYPAIRRDHLHIDCRTLFFGLEIG
jgi:hypothetical protein